MVVTGWNKQSGQKGRRDGGKKHGEYYKIEVGGNSMSVSLLLCCSCGVGRELRHARMVGM